MSNARTPQHYGKIVAGLFLLLMGLSSLPSQATFGILMLAIGAWLLWRQFNSTNNRNRSGEDSSPDFDYSYEEDPLPRQSGAEKVYAHALRAVEAAGLNPDAAQVLPVDLGVMVFQGDNDPVVYRTQPVPDDADYIQPFVQLRLPTRAVGRVKFEVIDSDGQVIFIHEDVHNLERGRNLVTPSARLPIHDAQAMHGNWRIRVSADGLPLANHSFMWQETNTRAIRRHITEDGELSNELRASLAENRLGKMSLDELLSFQEEDEAPPRQQRRS
ncbi:MAG: hypothetical protein LCI00_22020 [Chloroflexi bacterium]|nr:hypothetical protein [Chloroflexota bacterium]MCC6895144.1 hypothetical protein [Anaerolineae bacterium]